VVFKSTPFLFSVCSKGAWCRYPNHHSSRIKREEDTAGAAMVVGSHADSARAMPPGESFQLSVPLYRHPYYIYCLLGRKQGVLKCSNIITVVHTYIQKKIPINKGNQKNLLLRFPKNRICYNRNIF